MRWCAVAHAARCAIQPILGTGSEVASEVNESNSRK